MIGITAALTAWESGRPRTLPQPSGRYEIGRRFFAWRDEARLDPLSPVRNAKRELAAFIWYPASKVSMGTRAPYMPDEWIAAIPQEWSAQRLDRVHGHALEDAELQLKIPLLPWLSSPPVQVNCPPPIQRSQRNWRVTVMLSSRWHTLSARQ